VPISGGAGYGDVLERAPESVIADLRRNLVTHRAARNIYHVAYDGETLQLDIEGTVALRLQAREDRKRRAKPYDAFVLEWSKLRPPDEALRYYGDYPDPTPKPTRAA
jgi:acetophenone carboxylase